MVAVNKYALTLVANTTEGGEVSVYPKSDEYLENDEVQLTATENFGYDFVNWANFWSFCSNYDMSAVSAFPNCNASFFEYFSIFYIF